MTRPKRRVAVVGAGWAGLAAAVQATEQGDAVTLFEMAAQAGGRARSVAVNGEVFDNGQHILIGAYTHTLRLMRQVGVDPARVLQRRPLELLYPDNQGLRMPRGPARLAFAWAVARARGWQWGDRGALLSHAYAWWRQGMRTEVATVAELCARLPMRVRADLIDPLCIAALNTPSSHADATVFLRVLHDALFGERGGSDLLLPANGLSQLFPAPALRWLAERGAPTHLGHRVESIVIDAAGGWFVDGDRYDGVILACSAVEAARLTGPVNATWAARAAALRYEPIATVYLQRHPRPLQRPMVALRSNAEAPAQFAFDLELLGQRARTVAWVVSGARVWLDRGVNDLAATVQRQALDALPASFERSPLVLHTALERRATFACVPNLSRPPAAVAPGLMAAGDYIEGPYPATLEGAVRSGVHAALAPVS